MPPLPGPALTNPVEVTLAIEGALLVQLPPGVASLNDAEPFTQSGVVPNMEVGIGVTTIAVDAAVPQPLLYDIVMLPPATPVTKPVLSTEPMVLSVLLQLPPGDVSLSCVVDPWHTVVVPLMLAGVGSTVTANVAGEPQPVL